MTSPQKLDLTRDGLRNRYFVLRHGKSEANAVGRIASSPETAIESFGLTKEGAIAVRQSVERMRGELDGVSVVYTSDFLRARQTAEIAAALLKAPVEVSLQLRERGFGDFDGAEDSNYEVVWQADRLDSTHERWNVEPVSSVASRLMTLLSQVEAQNRDGAFLLVSHGDPLQILITSIAGHDLRAHRELEPLQTAEIRQL